MAKHRPAPRWVEFDFLGFQVETQHPERYRLKLDANLIYSWKVTRAVYLENEPDTSICVVFMGENAVELGAVMVDMIDYGEHLAPTINDMIYEARHPWLDLKDAKKKKVFNLNSSSEMLLRAEDSSVFACRYFAIWESPLAEKPFHDSWVAFKPINPAEYYRFTHIEAWKG